MGIQQKQELNIDPFKRGFLHAEAYKSINLNKLRLCFSVTIRNETGELINLPSVYTRLIEHSPNKTELRIREISDSSSSSAGGEKKVVICDRLDAVEFKSCFMIRRPTGLVLEISDQKTFTIKAA